MAKGKKKKGEGEEKPEKVKPAKKKSPPKTTREKAKENAKQKVRRFSKGSRFVLFVGDEGSILLHMRDNMVLSRQFVPDASEQNLGELRETLKKDPKAPFMVAIDSLDQSYIQQNLPPVSSMSVKKLIKRRLERDFGPEDIKGAILLGRDEDGRKDWNFLMVSVERGRQITLWLDFAYSLPNRFDGIYLVSVEVETVVRDMERAMGIGKQGTGSKWKFFISHNKVGGFRQVILQNGRIIFTRMAQPIGEASAEVLAGNIEQEMQSTMEYMKRLGYDAEQGLDIYIIAASAIKPVIDKTKFKYNNFSVFTPYETAQMLNIKGATQPTDQFGDVVLAGAIASSHQHILKLTTPESKRFDSLYVMFKMQRVIAALLVVGVIGYAGGVASEIYMRFIESDDLLLAKRRKQQTLDQLKEEIKTSKLDVNKTGDLIELYQLLENKRTYPLSFIALLEESIISPAEVKRLEWISDETGPTGAFIPTPKTHATLILDFPEVPDYETWKLVSDKMMAKLTENFPGYLIKLDAIPPKFAKVDDQALTLDNETQGVPKPVNQSTEVTLTIDEQ